MSVVVYVAAGVLALSGAVLFRRPRAGVRTVRNPLTLSTCAAIALGALVLVCSAPLTLAAVNDLTGVPNFGAPLTYGMLSAYSCSLFILLINWRGGSRERIRRMVLLGIAAYGALIVAIVVLFALADAHTERLTDLDTYYAGTPFMREMIVLYLVGHSVATIGLCAVGVKWGREVTGLLRTGLRLILIGSMLDVVGFQLTKYTAVVARWTGHDLDFLSTVIAPPMASLGALTCSVGFVLPRLLPSLAAHWHSLRDLRTLGPLWSALRFASTAPPPPGTWWRLPRERLQWREVAIHDALLALAPYFDDRVRERALGGALRAGRSPHGARLTAEAAMLCDAVRRAAARGRPLETPSGYRLHATTASGTSGLVELVELAQEFTRSSHVGTIRVGTVTTTPDRTRGAP
ncbi:MAB_1171c family putative transporter [Streptomyces sp. NPDC002306]